MCWQDKIGGCFGSEDKEFAIHPEDLKRAYEMLGKLLAANISMDEVEKSIKKYLNEAIHKKYKNKKNDANALNKHINKQLARAIGLYSAWLN